MLENDLHHIHVYRVYQPGYSFNTKILKCCRHLDNDPIRASGFTVTVKCLFVSSSSSIASCLPDSAADLGMFSMFSRTGPLTKRGPAKEAAFFACGSNGRHPSERVKSDSDGQKRSPVFQEN